MRAIIAVVPDLPGPWPAHASRRLTRTTANTNPTTTYTQNTAKPVHGASMPVSGCTAATDWPALLGRYGLMCCAQLSGSASPSAGSTSNNPNSVAMPPAVLRMIQPSATPSRPTPVRYRPVPNTVRKTSGAPSVVWMCWLDSSAWPAKNATNEDTSPTTNATAVNTAAFAHTTGSRFGAADMLARIMPVLYSPVTSSTPSTPMMSWASSKPRRLVPVGSKTNFRASRNSGQRFAVTAENSTPKPIMPSAVAASVM